MYDGHLNEILNKGLQCFSIILVEQVLHVKI